MDKADLYKTFRVVKAELEEARREIERLRTENEELQRIVSTLKLGGTTEEQKAPVV